MRLFTATISVYQDNDQVHWRASLWRPGVPLRWPAKPHYFAEGVLTPPEGDPPAEWLQTVLSAIIRAL